MDRCLKTLKTLEVGIRQRTQVGGVWLLVRSQLPMRISFLENSVQIYIYISSTDKYFNSLVSLFLIFLFYIFATVTFLFVLNATFNKYFNDILVVSFLCGIFHKWWDLSQVTAKLCRIMLHVYWVTVHLTTVENTTPNFSGENWWYALVASVDVILLPYARSQPCLPSFLPLC